MIEPVTIRTWERSNNSVRLVESADALTMRYRVYQAVYDGMKWQEKTIGAKFGYTRRGQAVKVYEAKVQQLGEMLTKQGR